MSACIICGHNTHRHSVVYDDRYGYPGSFELNKCEQCGHISIGTDFPPDSLTGLYTNYYPRSQFHLNQYQPNTEVKGFKSWLNGENRSAYSWVPENVRVLDIGCGFGQALGYHRSRGCDVYGVETDENIRRVAEKFDFKVHVGLFDPDLYEQEFFDYITLDQVIEHVTDPIATLTGIAKVLKPDGTIILSTPNASGWGVKLFGRRWINWHAPYHLQHFTLKSMRIAAERSRLIVNGSKTITSSEWLYYQWIHLLTFPPMGVPSSFWSEKGNRSLNHNFFILLLSYVHRTKINHLITRFFDALGRGDSYLFFLRKNG